jgi:hypothetical protein
MSHDPFKQQIALYTYRYQTIKKSKGALLFNIFVTLVDPPHFHTTHVFYAYRRMNYIKPDQQQTILGPLKNEVTLPMYYPIKCP